MLLHYSPFLRSPAQGDSGTDETDSSHVSDYEVVIAGASDLGDGMVDIPSPELSDLLKAADDAEGRPLTITGDESLMLGFAENPSPAHDQALQQLIEPMLIAHPEVTIGEFDLVATDSDLHARLLEVATQSEARNDGET